MFPWVPTAFRWDHTDQRWVRRGRCRFKARWALRAAALWVQWDRIKRTPLKWNGTKCNKNTITKSSRTVLWDPAGLADPAVLAGLADPADLVDPADPAARLLILALSTALECPECRVAREAPEGPTWPAPAVPEWGPPMFPCLQVWVIVLLLLLLLFCVGMEGSGGSKMCMCTLCGFWCSLCANGGVERVEVVYVYAVIYVYADCRLLELD